MDDEIIKSVGFKQIDDIKDIDYNDGDIAFHTDIRELPIENGSLRINMFVLTACVHGRMQVEINSETYILERNSMLICSPNNLITNCMLTPDFDGLILCLSQRMIYESMSESDIWNRAFRFSSNPIVHINDDSINTFKLYGKLIFEFLNNKKRKLFRKEIITSIVRAALYEMLADASTDSTQPGNNLLHQGDVLFKRFMELLTSCERKPRNVKWYADRLCITPKYLSTVCKQTSGKTAFEWINEYVSIDIRHMLKNTTLSVKEITDELNFPNMSFFGKYCRQHFGISIYL
jgi:AraC-like DNA-binding protein